MPTTAGLGGLNKIYVAKEAVYGTYIDPSTATGAWVPVLSESLMYREDKYFSPQIRETTIVSDSKSSFYHVEGDIEVEVDAAHLPYFLYASRHNITKTGAATPWTYKAVPSNFGLTYPGGSAPGLSITVVRNGIGFGYSGCVVGQWAFTIDGGILKCTMSMLGLAEQVPVALGTSAWVAPALYGADASSIYLDTAGITPTFAGARINNFNGYTATFNYNATAQNRIRPDRGATFIAYGETEATYETELDFLDRVEYDKMVNNTPMAIKLESNRPGGLTGTFAAATAGVQIVFNNSFYQTYEVDTPGMGDLVAARVTGRGVGIAGGDAYSITCKSPTNIT